MTDIPNVIWTEAATVRPGQRQHSAVGPREIDSEPVRLNAQQVLVSYSDGTSRTYAPHEDLPILDMEG